MREEEEHAERQLLALTHASIPATSSLTHDHRTGPRHGSQGKEGGSEMENAVPPHPFTGSGISEPLGTAAPIESQNTDPAKLGAPVGHADAHSSQGNEESDQEDGPRAPLPENIRAELAEAFRSATVLESNPPTSFTTPRSSPSCPEPNVPSMAPAYDAAVRALRGMASVFSPGEKLNVLHDAFRKMGEAVRAYSDNMVSEPLNYQSYSFKALFTLAFDLFF